MDFDGHTFTWKQWKLWYTLAHAHPRTGHQAVTEQNTGSEI